MGNEVLDLLNDAGTPHPAVKDSLRSGIINTGRWAA
jgi:hypothetical protein